MPSRPIAPGSTMETDRPAGQGISVSEAAAVSRIAFRPMRRRPGSADDRACSREPGRDTAEAPPALQLRPPR